RQRSDRGRGRARPRAGARRGRAGVLRLRRLSRALHRDAAMRKSEEATMTGIDDETSPTLRRAGIELVLAPRARDLGGFTVRRALPAAQRRMVGPFIFWDQMGPAELPPGTGMDVRPHPHIGLATLTYLFEGEVLHRDSLGNEIVIRPGELNWMTAGRGIVHSERTPQALRAHGSRLFGIQSWVALTKEAEQGPPSFVHHDADELPVIERD